MTPSRSTDSTARLAREVARQAATLGLSLDAPAPDAGRMIGVAFMAAAHSTTATGAKSTRGGPKGDDAAIKSLVKAWAGLHPSQVLAKWKSLALDPYTVVGAEQVKQVDEPYLRQWLKSDEFTDFSKRFPFQSPRKITLTKVTILYVGPTVAAVTYAENEKSATGARYKGNAVAIVMKTKAGWRIAVVSKQGTFGE